MGKMLKRVPLDFNWPIKEKWKGYLNPYYKKCPLCDNGSTIARIALSNFVEELMFSIVPGISELTEGLAGRPKTLLFHDVSDRYKAELKIIKAAGLDEKWGVCVICKGDAIDPEVKEAYEKWEQYEPPLGDGYQLWESTSEGSPISPVFNTPMGLSEWCEQFAFITGDTKISSKEWLEMINKNDFFYMEGNVGYI